MNYYNPYFSMYPYTASPATTGLASRVLGGGSGIKWGSILSGTQKVLGVANQAIPMIKQVSPVVKNAKTMFRVMNEFKKVDSPTTTPSVSSNDSASEESTNKVEQSTSYNDGPTFFI